MSLWRITRDSGLVPVLAGTLIAALLATALLPGAPEVLQPWTHPGPRGSLAAAGAMALLALLPLFLWISGRIVRRWGLVRRGIIAQGVVIRAEAPAIPPPAPGPQRGLFRYRPGHRVFLQYRFHDSAGMEHEGRSLIRDGWSAPKPGDAIVVLYDPHNPGSSLPEADLTA